MFANFGDDPLIQNKKDVVNFPLIIPVRFVDRLKRTSLCLCQVHDVLYFSDGFSGIPVKTEDTAWISRFD